MRNALTRYWLAGAITLAAFSMPGPACAQSAASATQPVTTRPETASNGTTIHGKVAIATGWTLQKPDLTRTVVYLASAPALDAVPAPTTPAIMAQHGKAFEPSFVAIARGTTVEFPNWDHFAHNVFSRSAAAPAFDLSRYRYGESKSRVFEKFGVVQMFCNIHPDMRAMVFVAPNTFFARTETDGRFEIRNVPPGQYALVTWNERCTEARQSITIAGAAVPEVSLTLQENRDNIMANDPPKDRDAYGTERGLSVKREHLGLPVVQDVHPAPVPPPNQSR
jgi:plastocyanin